MAYEKELARRTLETRAERGRKRGLRPETVPSVRPTGVAGPEHRQQGRFYDITGQTLWGFGSWSNGGWGGESE